MGVVEGGAGKRVWVVAGVGRLCGADNIKPTRDAVGCYLGLSDAGVRNIEQTHAAVRCLC